jgi:hypothetical protein
VGLNRPPSVAPQGAAPAELAPIQADGR